MASNTPDEPQLDAAAASQMLESVFEAAGVEPNDVPMEALASYTTYRKERFGLQRAIVATVLVLFLLLPLLFIAPAFSVNERELGERGLPVYSVQVDGVIPIRSVTARLGTHALPVYEEDARSFTVEPTRNGELTVEVTLANFQRATVTVDVTDVDSKAPRLVDSKTDATSVYLYLEDDGIGVNFAGVYARTASGTVVRPRLIDEASGMVVFDFPTEDMDVFVPDSIGNTVRISLALA